MENEAMRKVRNCSGAESPHFWRGNLPLGLEICPVKWLSEKPYIYDAYKYFIWLSGFNPADGLRKMTPEELDKQQHRITTAIEAFAAGYYNEYNSELKRIGNG
jgi:hypothetical protein